MSFQWYIMCLLLISRWLRYGANNIQSCVKTALIPYILFYFFLFYFPGLYFQHLSIILYSIYDILYTIEKLWTASFQWDTRPSEIPTHSHSIHFSLFNSSTQISQLLPIQLSLHKIMKYARVLVLPGCLYHTLPYMSLIEI